MKRIWISMVIAMLSLGTVLPTPIARANPAVGIAEALPGIMEFLGIGAALNEAVSVGSADARATDALTSFTKAASMVAVERIGNLLMQAYDAAEGVINVGAELKDAINGVYRTSGVYAIPDDVNLGERIQDIALTSRHGGIFKDSPMAYHITATAKPGYGFLYDGHLYRVGGIITDYGYSGNRDRLGQLFFTDPPWSNWDQMGLQQTIGTHFRTSDPDFVYRNKGSVILYTGHPVSVARYEELFMDSPAAVLPDKIRIPALDKFVPRTKTGDEVKYRPATKDYVTPGGSVVPPRDVVWSFPTPVTGVADGKTTVGWREKDVFYPWTGAGTGNPSVPGEGTGAWEKDLSGIRTNTDTMSKDISGVRTDVGTMTRTLTETETDVSINWAPLQLAGDTLTRKFPFSIPWDVKRQLDVFNVKPQAPKFTINKPDFIVLKGHSIPLKMTIDLSNFDTVAAITRWFLVIAFDVGVILSMRRFMPE